MQGVKPQSTLFMKYFKKSQLLLLGLRTVVYRMTQAYGWDALRGVFSKGAQLVFMQVSEISTEISVRLGRQEQPGMEPGTSSLLVLERRIAQLLVRPRMNNLTSMPYPGPLMQQPASLTTAPKKVSTHIELSITSIRLYNQIIKQSKSIVN